MGFQDELWHRIKAELLAHDVAGSDDLVQELWVLAETHYASKCSDHQHEYEQAADRATKVQFDRAEMLYAQVEGLKARIRELEAERAAVVTGEEQLAAMQQHYRELETQLSAAPATGAEWTLEDAAGIRQEFNFRHNTDEAMLDVLTTYHPRKPVAPGEDYWCPTCGDARKRPPSE